MRQARSPSKTLGSLDCEVRPCGLAPKEGKYRERCPVNKMVW